MITEVIKYLTEDGKSFDSRAEAEEYLVKIAERKANATYWDISWNLWEGNYIHTYIKFEPKLLNDNTKTKEIIESILFQKLGIKTSVNLDEEVTIHWDLTRINKEDIALYEFIDWDEFGGELLPGKLADEQIVEEPVPEEGVEAGGPA